MKKLSTQSKVGDQISFTFPEYIEGTVKEINDEFIIVTVDPEYIDLPLTGPEMGFAIGMVIEEFEKEPTKEDEQN